MAGIAASVAERPEDLALLSAHGQSVYLRARPATLADRVGAGEGRPWLGAETPTVLHQMFRTRDVALRRADQVVETDDRDPAAVAAQIVSLLGLSPRSRAPFATPSPDRASRMAGTTARRALSPAYGAAIGRGSRGVPRYHAPMTTIAARRRVSSGRRTGGWVFAAAQYGYAVWFIVCVYLALSRAAHFAGHYYVPAQGDQYTANVDVNGGWPWASLVIATAVAGPVYVGLSLVVSVLLLILGYARGHRALFVALLGSTIAVLATLVAALTPAGRSITGWLLD